MLSKSRRHFNRYREIARVLARNGLGWMLDKVGLAEHTRHHPGARHENPAPVHLRKTLEELGPTFVKLGQLLSTRPDIVPEPFITELEKLQDTASTIPFDEIKHVIESEFSTRLSDLYLDFDPTPIAAASLAQVHKAKLLDSTPVIVKVQRPDIREQVETDIEILYKRAKFLEAHWQRAQTYGVMDIVDEFAVTIREELDFTREARNTDILREKLANQKTVHVPNVYWELTTSKVLTLEEMDGVKITQINRYPEGVDPKDVAQRFAAVFLEQIFVDGFFHADPHPGNVLVAENGDIQLLDIGQVGRLDPESKAGAVRMLMAFEREDTRALADDIMILGIARAEVDIKALTKDLGKLLRVYYNLPARSVNMGRLLTHVLDVSAAHKIRLPVVFTVLGKVLTNIDGICRQLDPDFNFTEIARNYVGRAVRNELRSESLISELYQAAVGAKAFLFELPENLERLMRKTVDGMFRIEFKHMGLEDAIETFRTSTNRISIALIVGSIIIGSSLVVLAGRGPRSVFSLPLIGIIGYILATIFGIWLIVSIITSGRKR